MCHQVVELPSLKRSTRDLTRLDPRSDGNFSFGGRNWLYNSVSLDGSYFGNPFGLDDPAPGGQTFAEPVPYDAIEAVQVSVAPYDVRQSGFTGAAVNSITKSGRTMATSASVPGTRRSSGTDRRRGRSRPGLAYSQTGFSLGGPIVKDKAMPHELDTKARKSGSNWRPATGETRWRHRVSAEFLEASRQRMIDVSDYDPGAFENYIHNTANDKFIAKLDWNINQQNRSPSAACWTRTYRLTVRDQHQQHGPGPERTNLPFRRRAINNG
jgi:hypothetical protein